MPERLQQPRPMMAGAAGFDRDNRRCKLLKERYHFLAPQFLAQNRCLGSIHSMKLKKVLRRIHLNSANLFHGRSPLSEIHSRPHSGTLMPSGAVHTNKHGCGFASLCTKRVPRIVGSTDRHLIQLFHPAGCCQSAVTRVIGAPASRAVSLFMPEPPRWPWPRADA